MKVDIVSKFTSLPRIVHFEGIDFSPQVFINRVSDVRLVYEIVSVSEDSPHKENYDKYGGFENRLLEGFKGFLWLWEGIENDNELIEAIDSCLKFLKDNNLLKQK